MYVINRLPTKANNYQTPLRTLALHCPIPSVLSLTPKIFGCVAYVHVSKTQRSKIDPCAVKCVYLGVGFHQKGYKCYDPNTKKWFVTMDVTFVENESFFKNTNYSSQGENLNETENWYENIFPDFLNINPSPNQNLPSSDPNQNLPSSETVSQPNLDSCENSLEPNLDPCEKPLEPNHEIAEPARVEAHSPTRVTEPTSPGPYRVYSRRNRSAQEEVRSEQALIFGGDQVEEIWVESESGAVIQTPQVPPVTSEDDPTISIPNSNYILPPRKNRGMPPKRYVPKMEPVKKSDIQ